MRPLSRIRRSTSSVSSNRGQALVFSLVFLAAALLVSMLLYNSGLLANAKTQLQNAADAAAYSAAVLQARDHNFSAYTNRAMVANQIAVAQIVSLKSYFEDAAKTHDRANSWLQDGIYARLFPDTKPAWDYGKKLPVDKMESTINSIASPAVTALDKLIAALAQAQKLHHLETTTVMLLAANEVGKKNDSQAALSGGLFNGTLAVKQISGWNNYTKAHRANDSSKEADRFADVVVDDDTTDGFMRNRASLPAPQWYSTAYKFCKGAVVAFTYFNFKHAGATRLSKDKKGWLGLDATLGGGNITCVWDCGPIPCGFSYSLEDFSFTAPFLGGNGGALAGKGDYSMSEYGSQGWGYGGAPFLPPGAVRFWSGPGTSLDSSGGLQDYYRDIADTKSTPTDQTPENNGAAYRIAIEMERKGSTLNTTQKLLPDSTDLKLSDGMKSDVMRTIAVGQSFFFRPKKDGPQFTRTGWERKDGKTEMANLFNPYWQARLGASTAAERLYSLTSH